MISTRVKCRKWDYKGNRPCKTGVEKSTGEGRFVSPGMSLQRRTSPEGTSEPIYVLRNVLYVRDDVDEFRRECRILSVFVIHSLTHTDSSYLK